MQLDPNTLGDMMAEAVAEVVGPLKAEAEALRAEIAALKKQLDGMPAPADGKDGAPGKDGESVTIEDVQPIIELAVETIREDAEKAIQKAFDDMPTPKDGKDGVDGKDGEKGEKGDDGAGIADLMIDRDGELVATFTDGRMKNLGRVVGKDGDDGKDGQNGTDGIGLESFDIEYLPESHEVCIRAACGGRSKEIRYPAGGISPGGYWRDGKQAKSGQAWTHGGSLWIALKDTKSSPSPQSEDWVLAARKGRDGERGERGRDAVPPSPINLRGEDGND